MEGFQASIICPNDKNNIQIYGVFRLSVCYISRLGRGRHVPSLFLFIVRAMCAWLSVTVDALCSWREQCVTRGVRADVLEEICCVQ